jgi:hypothetical protein
LLLDTESNSFTAVAQDLERIACEERYAAHVAPLRERARRIRAHLHQGPLGNARDS